MKLINTFFLVSWTPACGNASDSGSCPEGFTCMSVGKNPNYGYTNFDWFGPSLLNMIRLLSKDFWENLFMLTLRASGQTHLLVFILVFFPGCFCLLCFILAVVAMAIGEQEKAAVVEARLKENDFLQIQAALMSINEDEQVRKKKQVKTGRQEVTVSYLSSADSEGSGDTCPSLPSRLCPESNCCSCWLWLKLRLHTVVMDPLFDLGVILILIINTLFMAVEHYPMTEHFERTLSEASLVFTFIFLAEMVLKIVAMGPSSYFKVGWNIFDSIIVVLTILELAIRSILFGSPFSFNLLRVFRLARWWPSFRLYLKLVWSSLWALRNLTLVLVLVVFLYSVVGLHLFGRDYKDCVCRIAQDCELPRWHMNDFFHSFLMVFRVLVWGWIETMWDCMEVSNKTTCVVFFMTLMIVGKLLVLSLFLTLLLSWICSESLVPSEQTESPEPRSALVRIFRKMKKKKKEEDLVLDVVTSDPTRDQQNAAIARTEGEPEPEGKKEEKEKKKKEDRHSNHDDLKTMTPEDCCCEGCYHCCPLLDLNKSQSTGRVWSNFRRTCLTIVQHQTFETFIIIIIVMSSLALVFEDIHLPQRHSLKQVVEAADQVFTFVFLLEMLLKWSALGLRRYFTDAWCWLDFIILNVSLTCFTADLLGLSGLGTAICSMRALMPLRVLSRFRGLRVVIQTLLRSLPTLLNVVLVSVTVWLVFSILGVNLFAGKFRYCFNETSEEYFLSEDVHNKSECFYLMDMNFTEIRWKNIYSNFDSVGSGYLSLFLVALSASPMDVFYASTDATLVGTLFKNLTGS
ncbi:sodium channel protein type 3 subunit alpha-like [Xyrichtys novacula]|uniref:Sodium channel protein type 3 subunit alpha-like n=1 Tax=Xyrichtys novacula TaxID=13765 RepID=A0AAV1F4A4_XYRNO|nr:sodium channel protein type 3 subunit alpha-like [Xyrichtys novacula]